MAGLGQGMGDANRATQIWMFEPRISHIQHRMLLTRLNELHVSHRGGFTRRFHSAVRMPTPPQSWSTPLLRPLKMAQCVEWPHSGGEE